MAAKFEYTSSALLDDNLKIPGDAAAAATATAAAAAAEEEVCDGGCGGGDGGGDPRTTGPPTAAGGGDSDPLDSAPLSDALELIPSVSLESWSSPMLYDRSVSSNPVADMR